MNYQLLGSSGLRVSDICLGTMTFGEDWGWGAGQDASREMFDAFAAAGGNFIDTSSNYTNGTAERFVGQFVAADRDYWVIATKYTLRRPGSNPDDLNAGGNTRKNMMRTVEQSLGRLATDHIDLLYLHMWDYSTRPEEVLRGLDDLVGRARCSTWASATRRPGSSRGGRPSPSCAAGRRSSPIRGPTTSSIAASRPTCCP